MLLRISLLLSFTMMIAACGPESESGDREASIAGKPATSEKSLNEERDRARAAIGAFATALQAELKTAMKQGGPINAIGVCNTTAMPITEAVSLDQGLELSRISFNATRQMRLKYGKQKYWNHLKTGRLRVKTRRA
jgi:hypothetical protein